MSLAGSILMRDVHKHQVVHNNSIIIILCSSHRPHRKTHDEMLFFVMEFSTQL
jgi:hypothetical protein